MPDKVLACRICYEQLQYQIEWGGGVVDLTWYSEAWVLHRWKLAPPYDNTDVLKQLLGTVQPTTTICRRSRPANTSSNKPKRTKKSAIVELQLQPAPIALATAEPSTPGPPSSTLPSSIQ